MSTAWDDGVAASRTSLLHAIADAKDVTFVRLFGNIGDELIYAGTRQLLSNSLYREIRINDVYQTGGHTALLAGGGGWCVPYHHVPPFLRLVEDRFERVIVLPTSFDISVESVRQALLTTKALVFAREEESYRQIRDLCNAGLAHDCAFYFDFRPYGCQGQGVLTAFRTDPEGIPSLLPGHNNDISQTCESLDEWLWTIARHATVHTDRAHVAIAAALLGKHVEYRASTYHKVPALMEFALKGFPVHRMPADAEPPRGPDWRPLWAEQMRLAAQELASLIPIGARFMLVDDAQTGELALTDRQPLPFLERNGQYWGPPPDDATGIRELERLHQAGAGFIVFAWPAFWWLDHYSGLHQHLRSHYRCILENERLVVFDLRQA